MSEFIQIATEMTTHTEQQIQVVSIKGNIIVDRAIFTHNFN